MAQELDLGRVVGEKGADGVMARHMFTLCFAADGWAAQEDGSFTQEAAAEGMLESDVAHVDMLFDPQTGSMAQTLSAWSRIFCAKTQDGALQLTAYDSAPQMDLRVLAEVIR